MPKKTYRRRTSLIRPGLWDRFHGLLITCLNRDDIFEEAWRICLPLREEAGKQKLLEIEQRYGVGHYAHREELLDNALDWLDAKGKDLNAIYLTLLHAKQEKMRVSSLGQAIDNRREFVEQREKILKHLKHWAHRMREFLVKRADPVTIPHGKSKTVRHIDDLLEAVSTDPLLNSQPTGPTRRSSPGHQSEPWLKQARRDLAKSRVPKEIREQLLTAVGLLPYQNF